ncbi:MAG: hypothetical protein JSS62_06470 [Verrucomicrobia bacterium]|nr:hypothetical protein [Verrucomicrobiota bacterium]MBS0646431.1 hypothetical protein [Verrucomicrobiota bacterium]
MGSESAPVNFSAIARKEALAETKQAIGQQIAAEDSFETEVGEDFNSMAAARAQKRYERFRSLDARVPKEEKEHQKIDVERIESTGSQKDDSDLAEQFSRRNYELPANRLRDLKNSIPEHFQEQDILHTVTKAFPDPTLADEALEYLEQATTGELKDKISRARQMLNEEKLREITGGRNIDAVAKDYAARGFGASPSDLRDLYRDITGTERDHNALFFLLCQKFPYEKLKEIAQFLLKSMAYDMKSKGPSIPEPLLVRLMKELKDVQSILWVFLFFQERLSMVRNLYQRQQLPYPETLSFEMMAKSFMKLVQDRYPSSQKVRKELDVALHPSVDEERIILLTQYRDAVRGLSPRMYQNIKHKQDLLLAIIDALTELEPEEEE